MSRGEHRASVFWTSLATLGPVGRLPLAPGTWGSLAAVIAAPWLFIPLALWIKVPVLAGLFFLGARACSEAEKEYGRKDPGQAVIDEVLGQWVTFLLLAAPNMLQLALGFFLFRLFDILKPWPVRSSETWLPGGYSVMVDDLLAGLYALAALTLLERLVLQKYLPALV